MQKCGAKVLLFSETAKDLHHFCIFYPKTFRHFKKNHLLCVWKSINEQNKDIIIMKKQSLGITLIVLGALLLIISYFAAKLNLGFMADLVDYNWYQMLALVLIIAGIVAHIVIAKRS